MPSSVARQLLATFVCKRNICPDRPLVFPYSIQNLASLGLAELRRGGPRRAHPFSERTEIAMSHRKHVATLVCNTHICPTRLRILPYSIQKQSNSFCICLQGCHRPLDYSNSFTGCLSSGLENLRPLDKSNSLSGCVSGGLENPRPPDK